MSIVEPIVHESLSRYSFGKYWNEENDVADAAEFAANVTVFT